MLQERWLGVYLKIGKLEQQFSFLIQPHLPCFFANYYGFFANYYGKCILGVEEAMLDPLTEISLVE